MACGLALHEQIANDALHINRPLALIGQSLNGVYAIVAATVHRFHIEIVKRENADDFALIHNSLVEANAFVPKKTGLFIQGQPVKLLNVHIHVVGGSLLFQVTNLIGD